jgi:hypothetical protein
MKEARDPDNKKQRSLRAHLKRVRAEAEMQALRNIQAAGLDPTQWRSSAFFLTNVIRGRYLNTARAMRPEINLTVADVARGLDQGGEVIDGAAIPIRRESIVMNGLPDDDGGIVSRNGDGHDHV